MKGLTELESLNLEHNRLQHIAVQAFQHVAGLKQLTLSHNRLSLRGTETHIGEVQSVLNACLELEELYVRNNSITTIFSDWILTLLNLRTLDLSYNRISSLVVSVRDFVFPQHCC
jgi:protein toll